MSHLWTTISENNPYISEKISPLCVCGGGGNLYNNISLSQLLTHFNPILFVLHYQSGWLNVQSAYLPFWEDGESEDHGFESRAWSSQTKNFKIDTCLFLAWRSALLR